VSSSSRKIADLVAEISAASNEQSQGIGQINDRDRARQGDPAERGQCRGASASEEMSAQAETRKGMVDELVALVGGSAKAQTSDSRSGHHAQESAKPHKAIASAVNKFKAKAGSARKSAKPVAEAVIPLDDDKQFSDF
jgi:methyl-accepting chemotaxis protein